MKMRGRRIAIILAGVCLTCVACGELIARYAMGLGDPPLVIPDADLDYVFAPNQNCNRFGNKILYNNRSMRSDFDIDTDTSKHRIMVVGDSIINGGALTSHGKLGTTLLQKDLGVDFEVCNISAGSWGPGNYVAYFKKYRDLASGDMMIIEVNSHDLWEDDPARSAGRRVGNDCFLCDHKPILALCEGFERYFIPLVKRKLNLSTVNTKVDVPHWQEDAGNEIAKWNLQQMEWLYNLPFKYKYLLIHRSKKEQLLGFATVGESAFVEHATKIGIPVVWLTLNTDTDYRDFIHMNDAGQRKLFELLRDLCVKSKVVKRREVR